MNKRIRVFLVLAICLVFNNGSYAASSLGKGLNYFDQGDYRSAVLVLKGVLQKNSNDAEARLLLGRSYVRLGQGQAAEKELRWARRLGIEDNTLNWPLGQAYLLQRKSKNILNEFRLRNDMLPAQRAEVLTLRGQAEFAEKNTRESKRLFEQALQEQPGYAQALLGLAQLDIADRRYRAAEKRLKSASRSDPACTECWVALGENRRLQRQLDGANEAFKEALNLEPKHPMAHLGLATVAIEKRDIDLARKHLLVTNEILPNYPLKDYLDAVIALDSKDLTTADEKITAALKRLPSHAPSVLLSGSIAFLQKQYAKAAEQLSRYSRLAKPTPAVRKMLATSELELKRPDKAIEWLRPLVRSNSADPGVSALFARAYQLKGDFKAAQRYLETVTKLAPESRQARAKLAVNRLLAGEGKAGVEALAALVEDNNEQTDASTGPDVLLILAALQTRDYERAANAARDLINKQPKQAMPMNLLGVAYLGLEQQEQARISFEDALKKQPDFVTAALNLVRMDGRENDLIAAERRLQGLLKQHPKNVAVRLEMASLARLRGDVSGQIRSIREALVLNPESRDAGMALTRALLAAKKPEAALNAARTLFEKYPDKIKVVKLLARAQLAKGEVSSAVASYRKLLKLQPSSAEAELRLATTLVQAGNHSSALKHVKRARELAPNSILVRERLVRITHASGNLELALKDARALQADWPSLSVGYVLEGDIHNSAKRTDLAISAYRKAFRKQPSAALALRLSQMLARAGDLPSALVPLEDWLRKHPSDHNLRFALSGLYQRAGLVDQAAASYETLLKDQPNHVGALNNLALVYHRLADPRALKIAEKAYRLGSKSLEVADTWGWMLTGADRVTEAVKVLEAAMQINDQVDTVRFHLAAAYAKAGMRDKARSELERLLVRGKAFPEQAEAKALLRELSR